MSPMSPMNYSFATFRIAIDIEIFVASNKFMSVAFHLGFWLNNFINDTYSGSFIY